MKSWFNEKKPSTNYAEEDSNQATLKHEKRLARQLLFGVLVKATTTLDAKKTTFSVHFYYLFQMKYGTFNVIYPRWRKSCQ